MGRCGSRSRRLAFPTGHLSRLVERGLRVVGLAERMLVQYGGTFVSLLFNPKKNQFNQKKHFQSKKNSIQSKKTFSINFFKFNQKNFFQSKKKSV